MRVFQDKVGFIPGPSFRPPFVPGPPAHPSIPCSSSDGGMLVGAWKPVRKKKGVALLPLNDVGRFFLKMNVYEI